MPISLDMPEPSIAVTDPLLNVNQNADEVAYFEFRPYREPQSQPTSKVASQSPLEQRKTSTPVLAKPTSSQQPVRVQTPASTHPPHSPKLYRPQKPNGAVEALAAAKSQQAPKLTRHISLETNAVKSSNEKPTDKLTMVSDTAPLVIHFSDSLATVIQ